MRSLKRLVVAALLSLFLLLGHPTEKVLASPIPYPSTVNVIHSNLKRVTYARREECAFNGNSDFYGLGIRISIYLQWTTAFIANHVLGEDAIKGYLESNTIFLVAVFVALAIATADENIRSAEIVVLLQLCFGFVFSILTLWGYRITSRVKDPVRFAIMSSFFRLALTVAICAYSVWFWFIGLHTINDDTCPSYIFFFARANIRGNLKILFEVQSMLALVVYVALWLQEALVVVAFCVTAAFVSTAIGVLYVIFHPSKRNKSWIRIGLRMLKRSFHTMLLMIWAWSNGTHTAGSHRPGVLLLKFVIVVSVNIWIFLFRSIFQYWCLVLFRRSPPVGFPSLLRLPSRNTKVPNGSEYAQHPRGRFMERFFTNKVIFWGVRLANIAALAWAILSIELTLQWNFIRGVSSGQSLKSTGQLIPLAISLLGLMRLFHAISVQRSEVKFTKVLVGLLDRGSLIEIDFMHDNDSGNPKGTSITPTSNNQTAETRPKATYVGTGNFPDEVAISYPLDLKYEAVFYIKKPKLYPQIPESFDTFQEIELMKHYNDENRRKSFHDVREPKLKKISKEYKRRASFDNLELYNTQFCQLWLDQFSDNEIDIVKLKDGRKVYFAKNVRRSGVPETHIYPRRNINSFWENFYSSYRRWHPFQTTVRLLWQVIKKGCRVARKCIFHILKWVFLFSRNRLMAMPEKKKNKLLRICGKITMLFVLPLFALSGRILVHFMKWVAKQRHKRDIGKEQTDLRSQESRPRSAQTMDQLRNFHETEELGLGLVSLPRSILTTGEVENTKILAGNKHIDEPHSEPESVFDTEQLSVEGFTTRSRGESVRTQERILDDCSPQARESIAATESIHRTEEGILDESRSKVEPKDFSSEHRRRIKRKNQVMKAWHQKSLYLMLYYSSEPLANCCETLELPKTASLVREGASLLHKAKAIAQTEETDIKKHEKLVGIFDEYTDNFLETILEELAKLSAACEKKAKMVKHRLEGEDSDTNEEVPEVFLRLEEFLTVLIKKS